MKYQIPEDNQLLEKVSKLSVEQLLKIVTCPNYRSENDNIYDTYCAFVHPTSFENAKAINSKIKKSDHPVLIATDMEAGPGTAIVGATEFPSMRAVCETKEEKLAYEMGKIAAKESREALYDWTFGPCVDILKNHFSPITSIRSASEDYREVIKFAKQYTVGLQENGLVATAKHFPGDGACLFDQHLTTAINPLTKEEWDSSYKKVYEEIINTNIKSIMIGHIALPCYDEKDINTNLYPPATLSYNLITKLLKEKLGFLGLIISDATEMSGFCGYVNYYEACARFLMSGGDCLLFVHPDHEFINKMTELIDKGYLDKDVLINRAYRVISFVNDNYNKYTSLEINKKKHQEIAKEVVEKSVKTYRDRNHSLPLIGKNLNIAHVIIAKQINPNIITEFTNELLKYSKVTELVDPGPTKLKEIAKSKEYDAIICTIGCQQWYGTNQITLSGTVARNMMNGWMKYDTPTIFVDFGNPYIHEEYDAMIDALIYTYGYNKDTCKVVTKKIFGVNK